jgi:hypothetical protein
VAAAVDVIDTVFVAVHVHGNDTVIVIAPLDDHGIEHPVSVATKRAISWRRRPACSR